MPHLEGFKGHSAGRRLCRLSQASPTEAMSALHSAGPHVRRGCYELAVLVPAPIASEGTRTDCPLYAVKKDVRGPKSAETPTVRSLKIRPLIARARAVVVGANSAISPEKQTCPGHPLTDALRAGTA